MSTKKMTLSQVMKYLEQQGDEKVRLRYVRDGAGDKVFGVLLGTIRRLAETLGQTTSSVSSCGRRATMRRASLRAWCSIPRRSP